MSQGGDTDEHHRINTEPKTQTLRRSHQALGRGALQSSSLYGALCSLSLALFSASSAFSNDK